MRIGRQYKLGAKLALAVLMLAAPYRALAQSSTYTITDLGSSDSTAVIGCPRHSQ